jgi:hypothetical protein
MKHCPQCKLDFPDAFKFCGSCGGAVGDSRRCAGCGELVEGKWPFCTSCGSQLSSESTSYQASASKTPEPAEITAALPPPSLTPRTPPPPTLRMPASEPIAKERQPAKNLTPQEWYSAADLFDDTTATGPAPKIPRQDLIQKTMAPTPHVAAPPQAREERSAPTLTILSAYGGPETPSQFQWWHGAILGLFFLLIVGGLGIGGWYWWSHRGSVAQNTTTDTNASSPPENTSPSRSATSTSTAAPGQTTTSRSADEEIKRLRERRVGAKPSESAELISAFEDAEKKYPNDYRFPYERAKLSIKGITTHHEAFSALALAGEKAIDNGKSQEMLDSLMADKDADFYKLSRGHHEWQALEEALRNKDKAPLKSLRH